MRRFEKKDFITAFEHAQKLIMREYQKAREDHPRLAAVLHYIASYIIPKEIRRINGEIEPKDGQ